MRNRCILSLLICGALLYYALPQLTLQGNSMATYFSWTWLAFLIMAIAGNLAAILYAPVKKQYLNQKKQSAKKYVRSHDH